MKLDAAYMKYINGKTNPVTIVKSFGLSGTLASIYRVFYLKNNYCLYNNDRILYLTKNRNLSEKTKSAYDKLKGESEFDYLTLFSFIDDRVDFLNIDDIIESLFKDYILKSPSTRLMNEKDNEELVRLSFETIAKGYSNLKIFNMDYIGFFVDEIKWMKNNGYTELEVYQNCQRSGRKYKKGKGPGNIRKNSRTREGIFRLFSTYEDKLKKNNLVDLGDMETLALKGIKKIENYTHIILDEARLFTKKQLEIVKRLKNDRSYGELSYIYNLDIEGTSETFITKPKKISELHGLNRLKSFNFKNPVDNQFLSFFDMEIQKHMPEIINPSITLGKIPFKEDLSTAEANDFIERFEYRSLKNGSEFKFLRDITRKNSIVLMDGENQEEVGTNEMKEIPVFSNIAAGEPIPMNPDAQDTFFLPEYWVKGRDNHFILHVKGDSMKNADINDGDFVVIRSTQSAQNRDIVAVSIDGSATLKRLSIKGNTAMLMPENERYRPIVITEEGAHILGVAVGLIKGNI